LPRETNCRTSATATSSRLPEIDIAQDSNSPNLPRRRRGPLRPGRAARESGGGQLAADGDPFDELALAFTVDFAPSLAAARIRRMAPPLEPALSDDLTGALNRRYLRELFEREWDALVAEHGRVALLVLDLDGFKPVNDRFGHLVGDAVLRAVSARLRSAFRDDDRLVRYGGDEFVVVLPGAGAVEARSLAERARDALADEAWADPATGRAVEPRVSFSIGVAAAPFDGANGDEVLAAADRRLYEEKGRRRSTRRKPRRRARALLAAMLAVTVVAAGVTLWRVLARPEVPDVGAVTPPRAFAPSDARREVERLRAEVERLSSALARERSATDRERFERRIRELETALVEAERGEPRPAALPAAPAAPQPVPSSSSSPAGAAPAGRAPVPLEAGARSGVPVEAAAAEAAARAPVLAPPQLVSHRSPVYPLVALERRLEATVELRLRVDEGGRVIGVEPVGPPKSFGFDEAARRAAFSAVYRPGTRDGVAVPMETTLTIRFVLGERR
jgi:TonB family protein